MSEFIFKISDHRDSPKSKKYFVATMEFSKVRPKEKMDSPAEKVAYKIIEILDKERQIQSKKRMLEK